MSTQFFCSFSAEQASQYGSPRGPDGDREMSARDKLAEIINEYMEVDIPESVPDKHIPTCADYGLADEIIEAGWRLPMLEITTVEELEALPNNEEMAIPHAKDRRH